jgi:RNA-directed DNA polymerase
MPEITSIPAFEEIFSIENLFRAWEEFKKGKKHKKDVADFSLRLVANLVALRKELLAGQYKHGGYTHFKINDPKPRDIHKASVRDRVVHHALYAALYPHFDRRFIHDSYSCRIGKGTHLAIRRFEDFARKESYIYAKPVWVLKCDIRKCFASVTHDILQSLLFSSVSDVRLRSVLLSIIGSFSPGIPLGNLTSQLFVNVYLHELDLYAKHRIRAGKYIRYADDFVIISPDRKELVSAAFRIREFLQTRLLCDLHPQKVSISRLSSGIDFLGWVHFPRYRVLRPATRRRMMRNLKTHISPSSVESYLGLLAHGNGRKLAGKVRAMIS